MQGSWGLYKAMWLTWYDLVPFVTMPNLRTFGTRQHGDFGVIQGAACRADERPWEPFLGLSFWPLGPLQDGIVCHFSTPVIFLVLSCVLVCVGVFLRCIMTNRKLLSTNLKDLLPYHLWKVFIHFYTSSFSPVCLNTVCCLWARSTIILKKKAFPIL